MLKKYLAYSKSFLISATIFFIFYTLIGWWRAPTFTPESQQHFLSLAGESIDLAQLSSDKPVLLYFWGSWCPVCWHSSPAVNALSQEQHYPVLTIAVASGDDATLMEYLQQEQLTFSTINDNNSAIFRSWRAIVTPSYAIFKQGKVRQSFSGLQPKWLLKLRLWLVDLFV